MVLSGLVVKCWSARGRRDTTSRVVSPFFIGGDGLAGKNLGSSSLKKIEHLEKAEVNPTGEGEAFTF